MTDPLPRLPIDNDLVYPVMREAQMAKQITQKCLIDRVERLSNIHLE
jgi:hypothetical protein